MKRPIHILIIVFILGENTFAQDYKGSLGLDVTRSSFLDPTLRLEYVLLQKKTIHSLFAYAGYQVHYQDEFGMVLHPLSQRLTHWGTKQVQRNQLPATTAGFYPDDISLGVYQGPSVKLGYSIGKLRKSGWHLFVLPAIGIKYQWYRDTKVNHDHSYEEGYSYVVFDQYYRIQSGKCLTLLPQLNLGIKKISRHFFAEGQAGISYTVKYRDRTIHSWVEGASVLPTPFNEKDQIALPGMILSFAIGYVK